jgi:protein-tyrosine phosphatase
MAAKIIMVCLGNICRSPLAEGILQSKLPKDKFHVDSAGTGGWHSGELPDSRSMKIASKYGIDISYQRARQFKIEDFHTFDYIYVMDQSNYKNVMQLAPDEIVKAKVKLILDEITPNKKTDVPDPYYGGQADFEHVFQLLDEACEQIAKRLL